MVFRFFFPSVLSTSPGVPDHQHFRGSGPGRPGIILRTSNRKVPRALCFSFPRAPKIHEIGFMGPPGLGWPCPRPLGRARPAFFSPPAAARASPRWPRRNPAPLCPGFNPEFPPGPPRAQKALERAPKPLAGRLVWCAFSRQVDHGGWDGGPKGTAPRPSNAPKAGLNPTAGG